jgi:phosphoserine aminotransferase
VALILPPLQGPAGFLVLIVRGDLLQPGMAAPHTPSVMNWHTLASSQPISSIYNTPPTFQLYAHSLMLDWAGKEGGVPFLEQRAIRRGNEVYAALDRSGGFYINAIRPDWRSRMSIPFRIAAASHVSDGSTFDRTMEQLFVKEAEEYGLHQVRHVHSCDGSSHVECLLY